MLPTLSFEFIFGAVWFFIMAAFYGPRSTEMRGTPLLTMPIGSFFMAFQLWGTVYTLIWLIGRGLEIHLRLVPFGLSLLWFLIISYLVFFLSWGLSRVLEARG